MAPSIAAIPSVPHGLAMAIVTAAATPTLLLDGDHGIVAASTSFCRDFAIEPAEIVGQRIFDLDRGSWDAPRVHALLGGVGSGGPAVAAYEIDLHSIRLGTRRLVLDAHLLDYSGIGHPPRLLLSVVDVTVSRADERAAASLIASKTLLLEEAQHRIGNSLQIIATVLMQSARTVASDESRGHLHDAHHRVMSIASVQHQLAASHDGEVALKAYFTQLVLSLSASMLGRSDRITIDVDADDSVVAANLSVSLGLIVTELVINVVKHAFPNERRGAVVVAFAAHRGGWRLTVSDDGVGIAADAVPGLGTSLVVALAGQLRAEVRRSGLAPGTRVEVVHAALALVREPAAPAG